MPNVKGQMSKVNLGFTLIETIIYSALTAMIFGVTLLSFYQLIGSSNALNKRIIIDEEADFLIRKIEWALSGISAVNFPAAGSSGQEISINKTNYSFNPIVFDAVSGTLRIRKGTGDPVALNSQNTAISDLNFFYTAAIGDSPGAIRVGFSVNQRPYQTTINLR